MWNEDASGSTNICIEEFLQNLDVKETSKESEKNRFDVSNIPKGVWTRCLLDIQVDMFMIYLINYDYRKKTVSVKK